MDTIACIFCGPSDTRVAIEENGYSGRQCARCGLIFVSPRPALSDIVDLYGHDDAHVAAQSHLGASYSKRLYARHNLAILRKYAAGDAILEIGAGAGFFLDEARKAGFDPYAIEFNRIQAEYIRGHLGIPCDVVSHFYDPIAEFRTARDVLQPDGVLCFETGNLGDVDPRYFGMFSRFQYPDHLFFFSERNIRELLDRSGFELLGIFRFSIVPELVLTRWTLRVRRWLRRKEANPPAADGDARRPDPRPQARPASGIRRPLRWLLDRAKRLHQFATFFLRYRVGRIAPKNGRPQTLIVVARPKPEQVGAPSS
jgi:hypothetical protein